MNSFPTNSDHQKIMKLIYSGTDSNDIIAFEIIKQLENRDAFFLPLISIYLSSTNQNHRKNIYSFLKSKFTVEQENYFARTLENPIEIPKSSNTSWFWGSLKPIFQNTDIVELSYLLYKRLKSGVQNFLIFDNGIHPYRREIFEAFLTAQKYRRNLSILNISGLFPNEMKEYADLNISTQPIKPFYTLKLDNLKSTEIPPIFFSKKIRNVEIKGDYQQSFLSVFPSFVFNFEHLDSLTLSIDNKIIIPNDWSQINGLKLLFLYGKRNEEFTLSNLDFIDSIPSLMSLTLINLQLSHPELLLQKKNLSISYRNPKFESLENYEINLKTEMIPKIANALKRSNLPYEDQKYYFKKLLVLQNVNNISSFSTKELQILEKINCREIARSIEFNLMSRGILPHSKNN